MKMMVKAQYGILAMKHNHKGWGFTFLILEVWSKYPDRSCKGDNTSANFFIQCFSKQHTEISKPEQSAEEIDLSFLFYTKITTF